MTDNFWENSARAQKGDLVNMPSGTEGTFEWPQLFKPVDSNRTVQSSDAQRYAQDGGQLSAQRYVQLGVRAQHDVQHGIQLSAQGDVQGGAQRVAGREVHEQFVGNSGRHVGKLLPGDHHFTTMVQGNEREYEIHIPRGYNGARPLPVIYMMHGVAGSIAEMKAETGMNQVADQRGFAVVYLQALPKGLPLTLGLVRLTSWNLDHGSLTETVSGYDDLNYIKAVHSLVGKQMPVDTHAQYIVGHSEGGDVAQYVARKMPGIYAGIAAVSGTRQVSDPLPKLGDPTAAVFVLGRRDRMLSVSGGIGPLSDPFNILIAINAPKVGQSRPLFQKDAWAWANHCGKAKVFEDADDRITYFKCSGGPVEEVLRNQGTHRWNGELKQENTSRGVADFLLKYRKPTHESTGK